jgi:competence protein ComEC
MLGNIMKKTGAVLVLLIFIIVIVLLNQHQDSRAALKVRFFDIGQGDAALIQFNNGKKMLVDCGPDKKILNKLGKTLSFFDNTIDYLVITHFDLDHYGGCIDVVKRYNVKVLYTNGHTKPQDTYFKTWLATLDQEKADIRTVDSYQELTIASTTIQFLSPFENLIFTSSTAKGNNYSIVFRLQTNDPASSFLFTGDIEEVTEKQLLKKYCVVVFRSCAQFKASILKIAHHGSDTSSSENFVQAVNPQKLLFL